MNMIYFSSEICVAWIYVAFDWGCVEDTAMKNSKLTNLFRIKYRKKLIICAVILIVWITIMLLLSSQNGAQTAQVSSGLSLWLTKLIFRDAATYENYCFVHMFMRKAAHIFLFAVMSALVAEIAVCFENVKPLLCAAAAVGTASLFAVADEWHKLFIPGRHYDLFDVLLNIIGAAIGAAVFWVIYWIQYKRTNSENYKIDKNKN